MITLRKHRFAFIFTGLIAAVGAVAPLFFIAGCRTLQQSPQELQARETLRAMTRGGVLPSEDAVARIESSFPRTTAGAVPRLRPSREKLKAGGFCGGCSGWGAYGSSKLQGMVGYQLFVCARAG